MTTTTIRTGSTRASRPVGLRKRVSARAVVPTLAGIAIAALAVTATVQLGAPNDGESGVLAVASVDELTAAGAQGYAVSLVSAVDDTQASDARTSDIASIVVTTPTPTPTPEPEPAPAPKAPSPESSSSGGSSYEEANVSSDPSIDATLARIAQCESGGEPGRLLRPLPVLDPDLAVRRRYGPPLGGISRRADDARQDAPGEGRLGPVELLLSPISRGLRTVFCGDTRGLTPVSLPFRNHSVILDGYLVPTPGDQ